MPENPQNPAARLGTASSRQVRTPAAAGWFSALKRTARGFSRDRVSSVAGGITFFCLLALFPAITAFVSLYGLFADTGTITRHLTLLHRFMPEDAIDIVHAQVTRIAATPQQALSLAGLAGLGVAFYSATGGMRALIGALNVAWEDSEQRGFIRLNLIAIGFTLGGLCLILAMLGAVAILPAVLSFVPILSRAAELAALLRWPLMFGVLLLALATLYRWGPVRGHGQDRRIWPGAMLAAVALVAASMLFSWYASNFANYNKTYGSLGAVIGLMTWLWISAMIIMTGAELNAALEREARARRAAARD